MTSDSVAQKPKSVLRRLMPFLADLIVWMVVIVVTAILHVKGLIEDPAFGLAAAALLGAIRANTRAAINAAQIQNRGEE